MAHIRCSKNVRDFYNSRILEFMGLFATLQGLQDSYEVFQTVTLSL